MSLSVRPLTIHIGAEVSGVDLRDPSDADVKDIEAALLEHLVLFFRDQPLTPAQHVALGRRFGGLHLHSTADTHPDHEEIILLENDERRRPNIDAWHTDVTMDAEPPMGSILRAVDVPAVGGDTIWASMYAAYDALGPAMQAMLKDLTAVHHYPDYFRTGILRQTDGYARLERYDRDHPPVEHPVVRRHPVTGRYGLFVNPSFTRYIAGMGRKEGAALLRQLYDHVATRPEFQVRFKWERDSIAFWDNRCTQHYAVADYYPHHRLMHRVTIAGDRPVC
jgi:taurine dioxygenase